VRTAKNHGIDISRQVCRKFRKSDFDDFDHIFVMDKSNLHDVTDMAPDDAAIAKVKLLLGDKEVPDPYYDDTLFEPVFRMVEKGCLDIIKSLT
jgi:protein-tyrosine phosphatase